MSVQNEIEVVGDEPTILYRFYDVGGRLLYIGITCNLAERLRAHARTQDWWPGVVRRTVVWYGSREEAEAAETKAVMAEDPLRNIQGTGGNWRLRGGSRRRREETGVIPWIPGLA